MALFSLFPVNLRHCATIYQIPVITSNQVNLHYVKASTHQQTERSHPKTSHFSIFSHFFTRFSSFVTHFSPILTHIFIWLKTSPRSVRFQKKRICSSALSTSSVNQKQEKKSFTPVVPFLCDIFENNEHELIIMIMMRMMIVAKVLGQFQALVSLSAKAFKMISDFISSSSQKRARGISFSTIINQSQHFWRSQARDGICGKLLVSIFLLFCASFLDGYMGADDLQCIFMNKCLFEMFLQMK